MVNLRKITVNVDRFTSTRSNQKTQQKQHKMQKTQNWSCVFCIKSKTHLVLVV